MMRPIIITSADVAEVCMRMIQDEATVRAWALSPVGVDDTQGLRARNRGRAEVLVMLLGDSSGARVAMRAYLSGTLASDEIAGALTMADRLIRLRGES